MLPIDIFNYLTQFLRPMEFMNLCSTCKLIHTTYKKYVNYTVDYKCNIYNTKTVLCIGGDIYERIYRLSKYGWHDIGIETKYYKNGNIYKIDSKSHYIHND